MNVSLLLVLLTQSNYPIGSVACILIKVRQPYDGCAVCSQVLICVIVFDGKNAK